jgi:hypothetical protein
MSATRASRPVHEESAMANEEWGPLAGLIGTWESGFDGLDVSYHNDNGKIAETSFR